MTQSYDRRGKITLDFMSLESVLQKVAKAIETELKLRKEYEKQFVGRHIKTNELKVGMRVTCRGKEKFQCGYSSESDYTIISKDIIIAKIVEKDDCGKPVALYITSYGKKNTERVVAVVKNNIWVSYSSELPLLKILNEVDR